MKILVIDSDSHFLHQFRESASLRDKTIEISVCHHVSEYMALPDSEVYNQYVLVDLLQLEDFLEIDKIPEYAITCEGTIDEELLKSLNQKGITKDILQKKSINKFQRIDSILDDIKTKFLDETRKISICQCKTSEVICLFHPYSVSSTSSELEKSIHKVNYLRKEEKILLIHFDPYYQPNTSYTNNISYLILQIMRKRSNLAYLIKEMVTKIDVGFHVLYGPLNMKDIECMNKKELEGLIHLFRQEVEYDWVIFNFCGVHLSENVMGLMQYSNERILMESKDILREIIEEQTQATWSVMSQNVENTIKAVMTRSGE